MERAEELSQSASFVLSEINRKQENFNKEIEIISKSAVSSIEGELIETDEDYGA